jgi:hypothetical protein
MILNNQYFEAGLTHLNCMIGVSATHSPIFSGLCPTTGKIIQLPNLFICDKDLFGRAAAQYVAAMKYYIAENS